MPGKTPGQKNLFTAGLFWRLQLVRGGPFVSLGRGFQVVGPLQGGKPEQTNGHDCREDDGCGGIRQ
jgi:hypothetical protein